MVGLRKVEKQEKPCVVLNWITKHGIKEII